jgi:hypothetical protein
LTSIFGAGGTVYSLSRNKLVIGHVPCRTMF